MFWFWFQVKIVHDSLWFQSRQSQFDCTNRTLIETSFNFITHCYCKSNLLWSWLVDLRTEMTERNRLIKNCSDNNEVWNERWNCRYTHLRHWRMVNKRHTFEQANAYLQASVITTIQIHSIADYSHENALGRTDIADLDKSFDFFLKRNKRNFESSCTLTTQMHSSRRFSLSFAFMS